MTDAARLAASGGLRSLLIAAGAIHLGLYLADRGLTPESAGLVVSAGLAGGAAATALVTVFGHRFEPRSALVALGLLSGAGAIAASFASHPVMLAAIAFLGMVNGMGRDRGAAAVIEQAVLPSTTDARGRTRVFAVYNVWIDGGGAIGALLAAAPEWFGMAPELAHRAVLAGSGVLSLVVAALAFGLQTGRARPASFREVSPETRRVVGRISGLFLIDALGGGFLTGALVSWFFFERFGVGAGVVGLLFAAAKGLNALSHLGAAWLANRIGLVNTMVLTHLPSSLLLVTVAFAPTFPIAAVLFLLREGLVEMDVPTRQSYVMALVAPEERPFASGVTSLVRLAGWATAPAFAGLIAGASTLGTPLVVGAGLKITYDLLLWASFRRLEAPEEREGP